MIELPLPENISSEEKARELIRMWHSEDGELTVTIDGWLDNPNVCGRLIVDLAVLIAKDYVATGAWRGTLEAALYRILSAADVEIQNPTNTLFWNKSSFGNLLQLESLLSVDNSIS